MATDFPASPSNGDTHAGFTFNSTTGAWESSAAGGGGSGVTSHANVAAFPASPSEGDLAYAEDTDALYLRRGSGWERIDNGGESPVILTEPPTSTQSLTGGATSTVTMVAQDPEGFDITYGIAYKTTGNARPSQLGADTTINQSTGVYTLTASNNSAHAGSFKARLSASDGANTTTRFVDFDLSFSVFVDYLVIGGGGGGGAGSAAGGGGGAGGYLTATNYALTPGTAYAITVGAGGAGSTSPDSNNASNGSNSVFGSITALGGGGGAGTGPANASPSYAGNGLVGGSGGGGRYGGTGGAGTSGQGNAGGDSVQAGNRGSGGGGGAGGAGVDGTSTKGGNGGPGLSSSITGTAVMRGGGGGGATWNGGSRGDGGSGGGGGGAHAGGADAGDAGTANTGGGGGGNGNSVAGVSGGSGVVIIAAQQAASSVSGTYTLDTSGRSGWHVYTFTAGTGSITF